MPARFVPATLNPIRSAVQKFIEITTTQNVTIEYDLAKFRERSLAWLLDIVAIFIISVLINLASLYLIGSIAAGWLSGDVVWAFMILIQLTVFFLYHMLFESWNMGQTPGKIVMGIKVVRLDGKAPEWSDVLLRATLHWVDSLFSLGVIGTLLIKTTLKSQRLGDIAANTTVIKIQASTYYFRLRDILNISTLENYQPVYPQVRNLSERDMIFIKNVLTRVQKYPNTAHENIVENLVTHLLPVLHIKQQPLNRIEFLKTLLRDYVVLTR